MTMTFDNIISDDLQKRESSLLAKGYFTVLAYRSSKPKGHHISEQSNTNNKIFIVEIRFFLNIKTLCVYRHQSN